MWKKLFKWGRKDKEESKKTDERGEGREEREETKIKELIDENHPLTISLGISVFRKHSNDKEDLIEKAD
ncbi:hypothetical protein, partial [Dethiothermospora halolimnae]|uniref:hypothetical protein n=1 Tax=Dethiothermospora halolimnae TaxID=3114390 RepID=UPI003CCC3697